MPWVKQFLKSTKPLTSTGPGALSRLLILFLVELILGNGRRASTAQRNLAAFLLPGCVKFLTRFVQFCLDGTNRAFQFLHISIHLIVFAICSLVSILHIPSCNLL